MEPTLDASRLPSWLAHPYRLMTSRTKDASTRMQASLQFAEALLEHAVNLLLTGLLQARPDALHHGPEALQIAATLGKPMALGDWKALFDQLWRLDEPAARRWLGVADGDALVFEAGSAPVELCNRLNGRNAAKVRLSDVLQAVCQRRNHEAHRALDPDLHRDLQPVLQATLTALATRLPGVQQWCACMVFRVEVCREGRTVLLQELRGDGKPREVEHVLAADGPPLFPRDVVLARGGEVVRVPGWLARCTGDGDGVRLLLFQGVKGGRLQYHSRMGAAGVIDEVDDLFRLFADDVKAARAPQGDGARAYAQTYRAFLADGRIGPEERVALDALAAAGRLDEAARAWLEQEAQAELGPNAASAAAVVEPPVPQATAAPVPAAAGAPPLPWLLAARTQLGLSQQDAAARAGISATAWSQLERGLREATPEQASALGLALLPAAVQPLRQWAGLGQGALARLLDVSQGMVSRWEGGKAAMTAEQADRLLAHVPSLQVLAGWHEDRPLPPATTAAEVLAQALDFGALPSAGTPGPAAGPRSEELTPTEAGDFLHALWARVRDRLAAALGADLVDEHAQSYVWLASRPGWQVDGHGFGIALSLEAGIGKRRLPEYNALVGIRVVPDGSGRGDQRAVSLAVAEALRAHWAPPPTPAAGLPASPDIVLRENAFWPLYLPSQARADVPASLWAERVVARAEALAVAARPALEAIAARG